MELDPIPSATVTVGSGAVVGVDAIPVTIEATMRGQEGAARILGLVDVGVREAYYRVLAAFRACGLPELRGFATINFTPADLRKTGSGFDLPMAVALAGAGGLFGPELTRGVAALGEVSLEGRVLPARGVVAVALAARARGWTTLLAAAADASRAATVPGMQVIPVHTVREALLWLLGEHETAPARRTSPTCGATRRRRPRCWSPPAAGTTSCWSARPVPARARSRGGCPACCRRPPKSSCWRS